jgi:hypothetical protein
MACGKRWCACAAENRAKPGAALVAFLQRYGTELLRSISAPSNRTDFDRLICACSCSGGLPLLHCVENQPPYPATPEKSGMQARNAQGRKP